MENRRNFYRLSYPEKDRPFALFDGVKYPIINVSEGGLLLANWAVRKPPLVEKAFVSGSVDFNGRAKVEVSGYIVRVDTTEMSWAIKLVKQIQLSLIMSEQMYFIKRVKDK